MKTLFFILLSPHQTLDTSKLTFFNTWRIDNTIYNFKSVVRVAELHIKRITSVDWNDQSIATRLFSLCLGEKINKKPNQRIDCLNEPANTRIRLKLFPYLLRSRTAANTLPQALQLVFDCLFGIVATNKKIKNYTVQFVHDIAIK
jgi:proteasome component ECM29